MSGLLLWETMCFADPLAPWMADFGQELPDHPLPLKGKGPRGGFGRRAQMRIIGMDPHPKFLPQRGGA